MTTKTKKIPADGRIKDNYTEEQWKEILRYRNKKKQENYIAFHIHFHKELDKKYIDIIERLPKREFPNYIRELIENDIKRTESVARRYLRKFPEDKEASEYYHEHNDPVENYVPLDRGLLATSFLPEVHHHFTHRMFVECKEASKSDIQYDEKRKKKK